MKKLLSLLAVLVLLVMSVVALPVTSASAASGWPSVSSSRTVAFIATRNFPVYRDTGLKTRGTVSPRETKKNAEVWAGDDCYVVKVVSSSVLLIDYPAGGRRKQAYCARSNVFPGTPSAFKAAAGVKTYKKPSGGSYGSIDKGDQCYLMGTKSGTYSYGILYPIANSKWKFGWVTASDYNKLCGSSARENKSTGKTTTTSGFSSVSIGRGFPSNLYLTQNGSTTCTLCAAAMMLRAKAYMNGKSNWSSITESAIRSTAWVNGAGLKWSFTYSGMSVAHSSCSGISLSTVKSMLSKHPEGIVLYCGNLPHAVLVMSCSGSTLYAADTISGYSGSRKTLAGTYLGKKYGAQSDILSHVTAVWYIK